MTTAVGAMAAAVLEAPGRIRAERLPLRDPAAREVLVRVEGCGVCASSLPVWEGRPWFAYPLEPGDPGHEGWGVVDAVGDAVDFLSAGERVAMIGGRAFAEYVTVPASHCVPIGDGPFPGEPLACAVNILRRAAVGPGERVAIVGVGFLGSLLVQLCEGAGADVVPIRRGDVVEGAFACVIECAGTQTALDHASALVGERGRLVIAGYHQDGPRQIDLQSWNWRGLDVVNAHERDPLVYVAALREAVALELDVEPLLTHRFPLDRVGDAFDTARTRPPGFVKAWVAP
jgi:threonine dehydrogenase-like Zn-dependent dehydrogenase